MITVSIVEDNNTIRDGLCEFINDTEDIKCVSVHSNCESLLETLPDIKPEIILLDIELPGISGIEGIAEINKLVKNQKIIILTIYSERENLFDALLKGAHGYLEKKTPPLQMINFLREVHNLKSNMNTFIARKILNHFINEKKEGKKLSGLLNEGEEEILKSLINGKSPKAIADSLELSVDTIYRSFYNIYEKLHGHFKVEQSSLT